jgi:hypothetical protein
MMQPISSLSTVSMSPSKSLATQRNGSLYEVGKPIVAETAEQQKQVVDKILKEKMPKIQDSKLLKTIKSLLSDALSSKDFYLRLDEKNFTFKIGNIGYCFYYDDNLMMEKLTKVLNVHQPKES